MKGDETENKKIGRTVNLLVRFVIDISLTNLLIFPVDSSFT